MLNSTNSASNGWLSQLRQQGDFCGTAILVTPEQVERYRNTHCLIIAPALREGEEVYHAQTLSPRRSQRVAKQSAQ